MLNEQVIPIDIGQGVDTKTDPKNVVAGKLLRLENAVFTRPKEITKRNGYQKINGLVDPQFLHEYNNELIAADQNQIVAYSPTGNNWVNKGPYTSIEMIPSTVDQERPGSGYIDSAVLGNYVLYAWSTQTPIGQPQISPQQKTEVFASIVDTSSGTTIFGPLLLNTEFDNSYVQPVKCMLLGGTTLACIYFHNPDGVNYTLVSRTFTIAGGVVTPSAENTISPGGSIPKNAFDCVGTPNGGAVVFPDQTGIWAILLNTSGVRVNQTSFANVSYTYPVHVNLGPVPGPNSPYLWIYFMSVSGGPTVLIKYMILDSTLGVILAPTTAVTIGAPFFTPSNFSAVANADLTQTLFYGTTAFIGQNGVSFEYTDSTSAVNLNSIGGSVSYGTVAAGVVPFSRSFNVTQFSQTRSYMFMGYRGINVTSGVLQQQPTLFLVCVMDLGADQPILPEVVARFSAGLGNTQALIVGPSANGTMSYLPNVSLQSALKYIYTYGSSIQEFTSDFYATTGFADNLGDFVGSFSATFDFNGANAYLPKNVGELAITNGALIQQYDGLNSVEWGFHLFPEITIQAYIAGGGGLTLNGVYGYLAIYQWTDAQGNLHQSAPSVVNEVTLSGGQNAVHIHVSAPFLTQKRNVTVAIFRTKANNTQYFQITDPVFVLQADSFKYSFDDTLSDADLSGNILPYTSPDSAVLENSTPPPSMILLAHNNRLWFVDSESPNKIWYTKSFQPGVGLSPSAFMTQQIDPKFGNISALAEMDEKLVTIKQNGIFVQSGDGVNDVGGNSTLSFPQFVPSDVGCSELKSVVLTPSGVMFKSINGIYRLDRALSVTYIGAEVEQYNSQTITDARLIPSKSQIRFLCSSGLTLVYDYIFTQWSTFTNHTGINATSWQNQYIYITTGKKIFKEIPGYYLDDATAFAVVFQTSWLALATIQGFQRVRRLGFLGDYINGASPLHGVQVTASYDFNSFPQAPNIGAIKYLFGTAASSGPVQYRERLAQQKCDSISLLVEEVVTGDSAEYIDITDLAFEAAVKKGIRKMAQSVTVT